LSQPEGGLAAVIFGGGYPAHHSEAAHVINVQHIHAIEREVFKIYPILAVGTTGPDQWRDG